MPNIEELNTKVKTASKWSAVTEIAARLVAPISGMVLARLLTPEAFGIVATITMIISFAEIFTDAGFQKYLIQHEFIGDKDKDESTNVAFWSNLVMSLFIWIFIAVFQEPLAKLVGNPGLGYVITIACVAIPLEAFSSIQMALYKRDFDFKTLFKVRMIGTLVPIVVTIPLAFLTRNFWALVIGTITKEVLNATLLTYYSNWKPRLFFSFSKLKEMLSFTIWSMFEAISIWLTGYIDVFIVGTVLSQYYLGLYKTASSFVGMILGLITAATTPILFSSLSRLQNSEEEFKHMFEKFQRVVAILVFPIGVGVFCYSDLITKLLLGDQWGEAAGFVGLWAFTSAIMIVMAHYSSEIYRAKGKPKLSVLAQWLHIVFLLPTVLISVKYGFEVLYISRSLIRLQMILVNMIFVYFLIRLSPIQMCVNVFKPFIASMVMMLTAFVLKNFGDSMVWQVVSAIICSSVYVLLIAMNKQDRKMVLSLIKRK